MTQAGVDLHLSGDGELLQNSQPSRRHKYAEDYGSSQDDEDPSWLPGEQKQKKKRRHHRQRDLRAHRALDVPELLHRHDTPTQPSSSLYSRTSSSNVSVELTEDCDIAWEDFRPLGTEMIICKEGRRMFPSVEVMISGLVPDNVYSVLIGVEMTDGYRYRYNEEQGWITITTVAQPSIPPRMVPHADSRNTGSHFMRKPLSFKTTKMTNNFNTNRNDQLILLSMRKYIPVITVRCHTTGEESVHKLYTCDFIAVTSYQRVEVTQLKIFTNQFAAAFRKRNATPPVITKKARAANSDGPKTKKVRHSSTSCRLQSTSDCRDTHSPPSLTGSSASAAVKSSNSNKDSPEQQFMSATSSDLPKNTPESTHEANIDYEEDEESMDETLPCLDSYFTDEPPHIRPFIFQPRYHYGLDPAYHPALVHNSRPSTRRHPPPPSRPHPSTHSHQSTSSGGGGRYSGGVDQEMLWSSVAVFADSATDTLDNSDCFGLGLLGESL